MVKQYLPRPWTVVVIFVACFVFLSLLFQQATYWDHASYRDDYLPPFGTSAPIDQQIHMESFAHLYMRSAGLAGDTEEHGFEIKGAVVFALKVNAVAAGILTALSVLLCGIVALARQAVSSRRLEGSHATES